MRFHPALSTLPLLAILTLLPLLATGQSRLRLQSGREIPLRDGKVRPEDARLLLEEAEAFLKQGRLALARDHCRVIRAQGEVRLAAKATALLARVAAVERSSFVVLKNGQILRGKLRVQLRSDHLGIRQRRPIPLWRIKRIEAEYFINYSQVTRTYYILTQLDVRFRHAPPVRTNLTEEVVMEVEEEDGAVRRVILGYPYELLRKAEMGDIFPRLIRNRVAKVVVYPALDQGQVPPSR